MDQPFLSVIIPVCNGEMYLREALETIYRQNYEHFEILVIDDGSTDQTSQLVSDLGSGIRYVYQPNAGPASARNHGIQLALGDIVAFLDVDDLWPETKLHSQVKYLVDLPLLDIVQGLVQEIQIHPKESHNNLVFVETGDPYYSVNLGSAIFRKTVFQKVGLFDPSLRRNEDTDWFMRAWENNIHKVFNEIVALYYRQHEQKTPSIINQEQVAMARMFKNHLDRQRNSSINRSSPLGGFQEFTRYVGWDHPSFPFKRPSDT